MATLKTTIVWGVILVSTQALASPPLVGLKFKNFPVKQLYRGPMNTPEINTDDAPETPMNWAIANAATDPPNFAGHFRVVKFSCGTECTAYAITDVISGRLVARGSVDFPYEVGFYQKSELPHGLEYHADSRLFVLQGCVPKQPCGSYYFVLDGDRLSLRQKLEFKPQPERIR